MSEFFAVQTIEAALSGLWGQWQPQPIVTRCPTTQALGRILATSPLAPINLPEFVRSSMDGYAVHAEDTFGATPALPAYLRCVGTVRMGAMPDFAIQRGEAAEIFTGSALPQGANAVVMVERTQTFHTDEIEVHAPVAAGENLIQIGEDVQQGSPILAAGQRLRPQDIGGLLAVGLLEVDVIVPPRVAIIGSGDELIPPTETPQLGQVRDINSAMLAALMQSNGAEVYLGGIAADTFDALYHLAEKALAQADILVISAGSSLSTRDLTSAVMNQLGQPGVLQHGLAVKPGKPTILGLCGQKPVIGLPGNPVSALLVAQQIVLPILRRAMGAQLPLAGTIQAQLTANIASITGREDTIPVRLQEQAGRWVAEPIFGKSNLIYTLLHADGLVTVPLNSGGLKAATLVEVVLFG